MFRQPNEQDKDLLIGMMDEFYHSPAVLHPVPRAHFERTFEALMSDSPYLKAYIIEEEGSPAGYAQVSFTHSNEAGGIVVWLEEIYIRPQYQGKGLGGKLLAFMGEQYGKCAARLRLETEPDNLGAQRLYERYGFEVFPYQQMIRELEGRPGGTTKELPL